MRMSERHSGAVTMGTTIRLCSAGIAAAALTVSVTAHGVHSDDNQSSAWTVARPVEEVNSVAADGCPIESHDGLSLYFASMRAGTLGREPSLRGKARPIAQFLWVASARHCPRARLC